MKWNRLIVSPLGLHEAVLGLISREAEHARNGRPARIVAKMNSLVDADVIAGLYAASQAGVEIDLLVRGICCLRPEVPGVSERIRVHAVIDRFLEHAPHLPFRQRRARRGLLPPARTGCPGTSGAGSKCCSRSSTNH